ncbi:gliding motility-associated C-terminal domain-containing protein [Spirosoma terrae]|uniref:Gliding motility-associated C-terminal domain-containing protein n=1 Tax=Spirosoma terrae TaxID=1968276 RepID=A0A6L9LNG1_9BACT|nr:gliding motility-associated C-terminal domain-containing protein [Spirosoma terrae]NDU98459.1 gliding motility-associated C-terminal domain-containing protein [Spirosoma terrae]
MVTASTRFSGVAGQRLNKAIRVNITLIFCFIYTGRYSCLAQLCPGLSNNLLINESFGTASNAPSLTSQTTYRYVSSSCPENGEYTLSPTVDGSCFLNTWHYVTEDHTANDVRGNMLIINASDEAGTFYQQPLPGLCGGTRYEFSVWGLNLLKPGICSDPTLPNLTIQIETNSGQVLQTIDFGSIDLTTTPTWKLYSTLFTAPTTTEPVVVKLINNRGAGGCGNDLALDDIQLKQCDACAPDPVFVPDVFTPNDDRTNEELAVFIKDAVSFSITIYNRWGNAVFYSNSLGNRWNGTFSGTPCAAGEYSWVISYKLADSATTTREYIKRGYVMLLR